MEQSFFRCPTCGQMDAVQKVSSVVESGTSHGTGTSYGVAAMPIRGGFIVSNAHTYTRSQSELSSKLAFPKRSYGCASALGGVSFFLAPISFCTITYLRSVFIFPGEAGQQVVNNMVHFAVTVFCIFIAICIGSLVYIITMKIKHAPIKREALAIWHQLFYCHRDDTIFIPGDPNMRAPASNLRNVIGF